MERDGLRPGHLLALAGAGTLLAALWLPWFVVHLGASARGQLAESAAPLGPQFAALADGFLSQLDGLKITAWTAFGGEDVALAAGAGLVIALLLAAAGAVGSGVRVEPDVAARGAQVAGLALGALVALRLLSRPGPTELLSLGLGGYVALGGCALMVLGGALGSRPATLSADRPPGGGAPWALDPSGVLAPAPRLGEAATSVAPPPRR